MKQIDIDILIERLKKAKEKGVKTIQYNGTPKDTMCPNCKDENGLVYEKGCLKCKSCAEKQPT
jgi:ribonucleoside-diphosphate reductase alpha chain